MENETLNGTPVFHAKSRKAWRTWLTKNHSKEKAVWLVMYSKGSDVATIKHPEAVEEALCFGWIDSKAMKRDAESRYQYFAQRKAKSNWSKLNRDRANKMIKEGLMKPAGQAMITLAKKSGTWTALAAVQNAVIPPDLQKKFDRNKTAFKNFDAFPPSAKRIILEWILNAKRPETRKRRIDETVSLAERNVRAHQYQKKE